jgi:hypothetical protein
MSVTRSIKDASASLKPVIAKNGDWPQGSEENARFWDASPQGELTLYFGGRDLATVEVGAYYYIDLVEVEKGKDTWKLWKLWKVAYQEQARNVYFALSWDHKRKPISHGKFELTINNQAAWLEFNGKEGTSWSLTMTQVDAKHPGCPYTT